MSREIARKIVEDIYSDTYISLKEDVSKIISEKAVDVLQDMKSHVAKKFFSLNEADSDDKSWDRTLDYARQGRSAPTVSTHTGQQYSGVGATRRFGQDLTSGRSPVRDDATRARVAMDAEAGLTRRGTSGLANRPEPAPATPAQGRAAARGDDMRNPPTSRPAPAARPAAGSQGVTGSEVAAKSGGQFMTRADRTNQAKVDSVLGAGRYKAGSAEANLALRDYYRQQRAETGTGRREASAPVARPQTEIGLGGILPRPRPGVGPNTGEGSSEAEAQRRPYRPGVGPNTGEGSSEAEAQRNSRNSDQAPGQAPGQER